VVVNNSPADLGEIADALDNGLDADRREPATPLTGWRRFVEPSAEQQRPALSRKASNTYNEARVSRHVERVVVSPSTTAPDDKGDDRLADVIPLRVFDPNKEAKKWQ
jgi:hypothetical protein